MAPMPFFVLGVCVPHFHIFLKRLFSFVLLGLQKKQKQGGSLDLARMKYPVVASIFRDNVGFEQKKKRSWYP